MTGHRTIKTSFLNLASLLLLTFSPCSSFGGETAPIQGLDRVKFGKVVTLAPAQVAAIRERNPSFGLDVFVAFEAQLMPEATSYDVFSKQHADTPRSVLRTNVIHRLKSASATSSAAFLAEPSKGFKVYGSYWLVNGVWGLAKSEEVLNELAKRDGVRAIYRLPRRARPDGKPVNPAWIERADADQPAPPLDTLQDIDKGVGLELIQAPAVWRKHGIVGEGVVSAVFDGGVHPNCPDLVRAMWRNPNEQANGKDDDGNGYVDDIFGVNIGKKNGDIVPVAQTRNKKIKGPSSHGTICSGLIAGRGASGVLTGVAPRSKVMACVVGSGLCIDSLQYALENGVDIVSMSFMGEQPYMFCALWRLQAEHASAAGLFLCGGAGNFATKPEYRGKAQIWIPKSIPCVMAGSGLNANGERAPFSSLGPVDWSKVPGYGELDGAARVLKPDVSTVSQEITAVRFDKGRPEPGASGNSFSGPQLAGCAALLLSANPELKPWQLRTIMNETAVDIGAPGWDPQFGWGRLDCLAAVERVLAETKKVKEK